MKIVKILYLFILFINFSTLRADKWNPFFFPEKNLFPFIPKWTNQSKEPFSKGIPTIPEKNFEKENSEQKENEKDSPTWFSINPGVHLESITLSLTRGKEAMITQKGAGTTTWMFDIKSRNYQISEYFGVHLLVHNSHFFLDHQVVPNLDVAPSTSEGKSSSKDSTKKEDLGTRISGNYTMFIPVFYFGRKATDAFRFGFGAGPSNVRMIGNIDFQDPSFAFVYLLGDSRNRTTYLNNIAALQFATGAISFGSGDPLLNYLIANISTGRNLENLGYYYILNNLVQVDPLFLLFNRNTTGPFNPIEIIALTSLARNNVNINRQNVFSFMFFVETPKVSIFRFRIAFGGPLFKENHYRIEFRTFQISAFVPIDF